MLESRQHGSLFWPKMKSCQKSLTPFVLRGGFLSFMSQLRIFGAVSFDQLAISPSTKKMKPSIWRNLSPIWLHSPSCNDFLWIDEMASLQNSKLIKFHVNKMAS